MMKAAVFGARGYLGRTLVQILSTHDSIDEIHPVSTTAHRGAYGDDVPSMRHLGEMRFVPPHHEAVHDADVVFLATPEGEARKHASNLASDPDVLVDLSRAHRGQALHDEGPWVYGVPELPGGVEKGDARIANPGCYPTATLLALGPALLAGVIGEQAPIVVDGKSGVSGAGATPRDDLHFPEANESLRAYNVQGHDHQAEIQTATQRLSPQEASPPRVVRFVPHLVPQNRGLLVTAYAPLVPHLDADGLNGWYQETYLPERTVSLKDEPDTAHVRGSHRAHVAFTIDHDASLLVARCAIDNLVKGGAGTAVHNMNLALGLPEHEGLPLAGVAP